MVAVGVQVLVCSWCACVCALRSRASLIAATQVQVLARSRLLGAGLGLPQPLGRRTCNLHVVSICIPFNLWPHPTRGVAGVDGIDARGVL